MQQKEDAQIYSGATPVEVKEDLRLLVDFQEEGKSIEEIERILDEKLLPHLMKYNHPGFVSMFNDFPEEGALTGAKIALEYKDRKSVV